MHEFNEAIRIADHWKDVNEDAWELLQHLVNARTSYMALVRAADVAIRTSRWTYDEGDSPGGYWAHLLDHGTQAATVYEPDLVERIVALLNATEATP